MASKPPVARRSSPRDNQPKRLKSALSVFSGLPHRSFNFSTTVNNNDNRLVSAGRLFDFITATAFALFYSLIGLIFTSHNDIIGYIVCIKFTMSYS